MIQHLNPATALSGHRKSLARLIGNTPHRAATSLAPIGSRQNVYALRHSKLGLAMATNHQGYKEPCDTCIDAGWFAPFLLGYFSLRGHCMQCPRSTHVVHRHAQSTFPPLLCLCVLCGNVVVYAPRVWCCVVVCGVLQ